MVLLVPQIDLEHRITVCDNCTTPLARVSTSIEEQYLVMLTDMGVEHQAQSEYMN